MKRRITFLLIPFVLGACASSSGTPPQPGAPAPGAAAPAAAPAEAAPSPPPATAPVPDEAPDGWQNLDLTNDGVPGTSTERAIAELLAGREPARTVVVAVIDGGVDTAHVDLRGAMWHNPDETPGNDRDDDGNGYVDDVFGWNFIGGADGRNVDHDTYEVTRLHARCLRGDVPPALDCAEIGASYDELKNETDGLANQVGQLEGALDVIVPALQEATGEEELTEELVEAFQTTDPRLSQMRDFYLQLAGAGITAETLQDIKEDVNGRALYGLDTDFDPRDIVGDDFGHGNERHYGNADVTGPGPEHGSHVAGIIAGARNGLGNDGIAAPNVRIMAVRAVPDGDERDKDVANAIRYAVDEGAHIINMSFGKDYSPRKHLVDEAIRYADERGVLLVHAAGNDGSDLETEDNFPTPIYDDGSRATRWIEVGASNWKIDSLATSFSNYGQTKVDLFSPGIEILSAAPGDEFERQQGTSMASPVVSGVAALLMAYFPDLSATDVRDILLESSVRYGDRMVPQPGAPSPTGDPAPVVPFGTLSVTGGVVNTYEAVRLALEREGR